METNHGQEKFSTYLIYKTAGRIVRKKTTRGVKTAILDIYISKMLRCSKWFQILLLMWSNVNISNKNADILDFLNFICHISKGLEVLCASHVQQIKILKSVNDVFQTETRISSPQMIHIIIYKAIQCLYKQCRHSKL